MTIETSYLIRIEKKRPAFIAIGLTSLIALTLLAAKDFPKTTLQTLVTTPSQLTLSHPTTKLTVIPIFATPSPTFPNGTSIPSATSMPIQELQAYVTLIKDIITGLSALTAAIIAVLGLQAWKKQLKGKTEYEIAQKLLKAVYKVREAFSGVRSMLMDIPEQRQAVKELKIEENTTDPNFHNTAVKAVYQMR